MISYVLCFSLNRKTEIVPTTENNSSLTTILLTYNHKRYITNTVIELLLFTINQTIQDTNSASRFKETISRFNALKIRIFLRMESDTYGIPIELMGGREFGLCDHCKKFQAVGILNDHAWEIAFERYSKIPEEKKKGRFINTMTD